MLVMMVKIVYRVMVMVMMDLQATVKVYAP
jgi:hypothetical protein